MDKNGNGLLALTYTMLGEIIFIFLYNNVIKNGCRTAKTPRMTLALQRLSVAS